MNDGKYQNIAKKCRACLNAIASTQIVTDEEKQIAADANEQPANNLLSPILCKLFLDFTTLDVSLEVKEFPKHLCQLCFANLIECDDFRKKALISTGILKESLKDHLNEDAGDNDDADEARIPTVNSFVKEEPTYSDSEIDPKEFCAVGIDDHDSILVEFKIDTDGDDNFDIDGHDNVNDESDINKGEKKDIKDMDDFKVDIGETELTGNDDANYIDNIDDCVRSNSTGSRPKSCVFERLSEDLDDQELDSNIGAEDDSSAISKTKKIPTKEIKDENLYCFECNKQFRMELSFKAHMLKVHHGIERPFACEKCSKTYTTNNQLNIHIRDKCDVSQIKNTILKDNVQYTVIKACGRQTKSGSVSCEICGKELKNKRSLAMHMDRHKGIKAYECEICGVSKTTVHELNVHMRVHAEDVEKFKCSQCPQTFSHKNAIARHVRVIHEGIKRFLCSQCPKRFSTHNAQVSHEKGTHGEGRNFICKTCYRSFTMEKTLTNHLKKHQKITCNLCPKRFMNLKTLAGHQKVHLGDNPIICNVCSHGFHSILDLQEHSKQHENEKCVDDNAVSQDASSEAILSKNTKRKSKQLKSDPENSGSQKKLKKSGRASDTALTSDIKTTTETDSTNKSLNNKRAKNERRRKCAVKRSNNISEGGSPKSDNQENERKKKLAARHSARTKSRNKSNSI